MENTTMDMEMITDLMEAVMILALDCPGRFPSGNHGFPELRKERAFSLSVLSGSVMYSVSLANSCNSAWA